MHYFKKKQTFSVKTIKGTGREREYLWFFCVCQSCNATQLHLSRDLRMWAPENIAYLEEQPTECEVSSIFLKESWISVWATQIQVSMENAKMVTVVSGKVYCSQIGLEGRMNY